MEELDPTLQNVELTKELQSRLADVRDRIRRAGGDGPAVSLVAVMKKLTPLHYEAAQHVGLHVFAENRLDGLVNWQTATRSEQPRFDQPRSDRPSDKLHFIGNIQRRDVQKLAPHVSRWQTVDRVESAQEIMKYAPNAQVLVQVNATEEPQKHGVELREAPKLIEQVRALGLDVLGVMTMGKQDDPNATQRAFAATRELADAEELGEVSMGMSNDFELAVKEGSTMLRLGTVLFGARP